MKTVRGRFRHHLTRPHHSEQRWAVKTMCPCVFVSITRRDLQSTIKYTGALDASQIFLCYFLSRRSASWLRCGDINSNKAASGAGALGLGDARLHSEEQKSRQVQLKQGMIVQVWSDSCASRPPQLLRTDDELRPRRMLSSLKTFVSGRRGEDGPPRMSASSQLPEGVCGCRPRLLAMQSRPDLC
jgi:hypothetical protein